MTSVLVLLLVGAVAGSLAALVRELRRDGYGIRPGPRSHPEQAALHPFVARAQHLHEGS